MTITTDFLGSARKVTVVVGMEAELVEVLVDADGRQCHRNWDNGDLEGHEREVHHRLVALGLPPLGDLAGCRWDGPGKSMLHSVQNIAPGQRPLIRDRLACMIFARSEAPPRTRFSLTA